MAIKLISWDRTSISAKNIARYFPGKNRIRPNGNYRPKTNDVIINWGYRGEITAFDINRVNILNKPANVANASDKRRTLRILSEAGIPTLDYATNINGAAELFNNSTHVYCRTLISSHSGRGIVIASNPSELVNADLYTAKFENNTEFRVHVFNGNVIDITQKKSMSRERREKLGVKVAERRDEVRNLMSGWSFVRSDMDLYDSENEPRTGLFTIPVEATRALGVDFAGVDLLLNTETNEIRVVEVNTACGQKVNTTTHFRYIEAICKYANIEFNQEIYSARYGGSFQNEHNNNLNNFINDINS